MQNSGIEIENRQKAIRFGSLVVAYKFKGLQVLFDKFKKQHYFVKKFTKIKLHIVFMIEKAVEVTIIDVIQVNVMHILTKFLRIRGFKCCFEKPLPCQLLKNDLLN